MIIDTQLASHEHIVRTTQQWEAASVKYKIIPNGCLCVELTPDGKTRVKIGEGNKYYEQLPYVDAEIDMEEIIRIVEEHLQYYATQEYVDTKIDVVDKKVDELDEDVASLEETVNKYDERIATVEDEVSTYDERITTVENEVSTYDNRIDSLEEKAHTHNNKSILDNTTASFTISDETKLDGIEDHANNYSLPKATTTSLGGIIVGENLTVTDGVLSANPGGYTLPKATEQTLGGVKIGNRLSIDSSGVLSADDQSYSLPKASDTTLGGVKIDGHNLSIDNDGILYATDTNTEYDAGTGIRIDTPASGNDEIVNTGVLDVTKNSSGNLVISKESGDSTITLPQEYALPPATSYTLGGVIVGNNIHVDTNGVISVDDPPEPYSLPKASDTTLGGIKVGENLTITSDGTLNASGGGSYVLPPATDHTLGGIIVGNNLTITSQGVLSADTQSITVDDELDDTSENPVQNKVLTPMLEGLNTRITPISKQQIDVWWGSSNTSDIVIGNAFQYLEGIVDNSVPIIGSFETITDL